MFIEDILEKFVISGLSGVSRFDKNVLSSLNAQSWSMTDSQKKLLEKLLNRYKHLLEQIYQKNIDNDLQFPKYLRESRIKSTFKKISISREPLQDPFIKIEFPYDPPIIQEFQSRKSQLRNTRWDSEKKHWRMTLAEENLIFCKTLTESFGFETTEEIKDYFDQFQTIEKNLENYVPMLDRNQEGYFFKNFPFFTENLGNDLLTALFIARKYAVNFWTDSIENELYQLYNDTLITKFLKSPVDQKFEVGIEENLLDQLKIILKFLTPCLVVLPSNQELSKLKFTLNLFSNLNIDQKDVSVMFRLSNTENPEFNQFVREKEINTLVNENTKIVVIGNKIPKPLIEQNLYFNSIISNNYHHAHYTIINFLKNHHNIIQINEK
jgi:hypothetical protein